jgi:hypothetical protein
MIFDMGRMTSAADESTMGTLTLDGLRQSIEVAMRELENAAPLFAGGALQVRESQYATMTEPTRTHKKRRNQSEAYHRRVRKKWVKRWGTKQVPCAYLIDNGVLGLPGRTLVAHPQHIAALRNLGPNAEATWREETR